MLYENMEISIMIKIVIAQIAPIDILSLLPPDLNSAISFESLFKISQHHNNPIITSSALPKIIFPTLHPDVF